MISRSRCNYRLIFDNWTRV